MSKYNYNSNNKIIEYEKNIKNVFIPKKQTQVINKFVYKNHNMQDFITGLNVGFDIIELIAYRLNHLGENND